MTEAIFVNMAVKDLRRSMDFFAALGYTFNPEYTNDDAACMIVSSTIYVMLLQEPFFQSFTDKALVDATQAAEMIVCLQVESRKEVDALVTKAVAAGATTPRAPQEYGFMYGHGYTDLDGHIWELVAMTPGGG